MSVHSLEQGIICISFWRRTVGDYDITNAITWSGFQSTLCDCVCDIATRLSHSLIQCERAFRKVLCLPFLSLVKIKTFTVRLCRRAPTSTQRIHQLGHQLRILLFEFSNQFVCRILIYFGFILNPFCSTMPCILIKIE